MNENKKKADNMALAMEFLSSMENTQDLEGSEEFGEFLRMKAETFGEEWVFENDDLLVEEFRSTLP